jgi:hypothetical protein
MIERVVEFLQALPEGILCENLGTGQSGIGWWDCVLTGNETRRSV